MRVERTEHAVDRGLDELLFVRLLDIIGANLLENVAEEVEITVGVRGGRACRSRRKNRRLCCKHSKPRAQNGAYQYRYDFAHHPRTFCNSGFAHHGPGSIA